MPFLEIRVCLFGSLIIDPPHMVRRAGGGVQIACLNVGKGKGQRELVGDDGIKNPNITSLYNKDFLPV